MYIIAIIDDASRVIVGCDVFFEDNYVNFMSVLKSAVKKFGKPKLLNADNGEEYSVGLCERAETTGIYYAKNTEDAILRQIIEYVASSNFYLVEDEAESYQINEKELKTQLEKWKNNFSGIINDEYINIIEKLSELSLKHIKCQYGEWYALLTLEEQDELIDKYIKFDLLDEEFEWYIE